MSAAMPGKPYSQGATLTAEGINFALYSRHAEAVDLLLFDAPDGDPSWAIPVGHRTGDIWHVFVPGLKSGQLYGYRVHGPFDPAKGLWFNSRRLLVDPYARALTHSPVASDCRYEGYTDASDGRHFVLDDSDNTRVAPKGVVVDNAFDWQGDRPLRLPRESLIVYEVHVKGFTAHPSSGVKLPGTYAGFMEKIPYLKALGINAVELLPIQEAFSPAHLLRKDLFDYWGYNTLAFFAPARRYAADGPPGSQIGEFKTLVKALHQAGIEVILDVVYNHTGEGNEWGPTVSFRGIDNPSYYLLEGPPEAPALHYRNDAGTGSVLNIESPQVLRLVLDSLRYWVQEMHVDGFRFDLATILGREQGLFHPNAPFFRAVATDPVLSKTRLIAEPWDLTAYQAGNFPHGWMEWNDRYRDTLRRFLKGDPGQIKDLGRRLTGSEDLHRHRGGHPFYSINFITCHDGFTLHDLYAYGRKHNEANGEQNRDGSDANHSWNCGEEGETRKAGVVALRKRMMKNAFCGLFCSLGLPMMGFGDERMRSQGGNNNAYCQDNALSWLDWTPSPDRDEMLRFVQRLIAFRRAHAVLMRRTFVAGFDFSGNSVPDIAWFDLRLRPPQWDNPRVKWLCFQLDGAEMGAAGYRLFFILNADAKAHAAHLPQNAPGPWRRVLDTALTPPMDISEPGAEPVCASQKAYKAKGHSVVVLKSG